MIIITALLSVAVFLLAFSLLGIVPVAIGATRAAQQAVSVMRDPALDDDAREQAVRKTSIVLFGNFASILIRSVIALLCAALPIYAGDLLGLAAMEDVTGFLSRWDVIIILTVVISAGWYLRSRP